MIDRRHQIFEKSLLSGLHLQFKSWCIFSSDWGRPPKKQKPRKSGALINYLNCCGCMEPTPDYTQIFILCNNLNIVYREACSDIQITDLNTCSPPVAISIVEYRTRITRNCYLVNVVCITRKVTKSYTSRT